MVEIVLIRGGRVDRISTAFSCIIYIVNSYNCYFQIHVALMTSSLLILMSQRESEIATIPDITDEN